MEKAVLVIDMPYDCYACKIASNSHCRKMRDITANSGITGQRPPYCPLKALPEKCDIKKLAYTKDDADFMIGWNACIDTIAGKEDAGS